MSGQENVQKLISINSRRLQKLKEQQALKGANADPALLIEIEDLGQELENLYAQLGQSARTAEPTPRPAAVPTEGVPRAESEERDHMPRRGDYLDQTREEPASSSSGGSKWWIPIVVALIGLAGVVFATVWNNPSPPIEPRPGEEQPAEFTYEVRVESDTGEPLPDASVSIEVEGRPTLHATTGPDGMAGVFIDAAHAGAPGFLFVEREGFHGFSHEVELNMEILPPVVSLEPIP